jgi:DNA-binding IclR family transcriptional regulator
MAANPIPDHIRRFILKSIDSIAQLEALLLLRSRPQEKWSVEAVAKRLYISDQETSDLLGRLSAEGFIRLEDNEPDLYQYQPESAELDQVVDQVAEIYSKHLVPVTNLIHSKPRTRIQEFADAFKLRKDE